MKEPCHTPPAGEAEFPIERIEEGKRAWLPLLLVGDESERMIDGYLDRGVLYGMRHAGEPCGVCVATDEGDGCCEIRNLAVAAPYRRRGLGRRLLAHAERCCGPQVRTLVLGTGETPATCRFYEACGFVRTHRIPDYFVTRYDAPVVDEGAVLRDMIRFRKERTPIELESERLLLRPWCASDAEALYRHAKDPAVGPVAGWPPHRSVEESREVIRTVFAAPECYAVVLRETGEAVGAVALLFADTVHTASVAEGEAELGYWIGRSCWGRGLIPEAVRCLLRHAFGELHLRRVWCGWYEGNDRSRRVQEKCGFRYHHTEYGKRSPLGDLRTEHFSVLERERWAEREG